MGRCTCVLLLVQRSRSLPVRLAGAQGVIVLSRGSSLLFKKFRTSCSFSQLSTWVELNRSTLSCPVALRNPHVVLQQFWSLGSQAATETPPENSALNVFVRSVDIYAQSTARATYNLTHLLTHRWMLHRWIDSEGAARALCCKERTCGELLGGQNYFNVSTKIAGAACDPAVRHPRRSHFPCSEPHRKASVRQLQVLVPNLPAPARASCVANSSSFNICS